VIGSSFHFCVARFKFSHSTFLDGCINVDSIVRNFFSLQIDDYKHFGVAQTILLYDTVAKSCS